jgi:hypothetical protein
MKALITLIAMTVLTCSAFASSPYGPNVESAEGKAVILNHVGEASLLRHEHCTYNFTRSYHSVTD